MNQTYTNYELILVNDGATDSCPEICRRMEKQDSRIRVVDKKNGGLSSARNAGLQVAKGEYILFIDSDDWIDPDMLSHLYTLLKEQNADLSVCNFYTEEPDGKNQVFESFKLPKTPYTTADIPEAIAIQEYAFKFPYSWNKLFRADIIRENAIAYDDFFVGAEDLDFILKYMRYVSHCVISDKPCYHYIKHGTGSLCAKYKKGLYDIVSEVSTRRQETYRYFGMLDRDDTRLLYERTHVDYIASCVPNMFRQNSGLSPKEKRNQLRQLFQDERLRQYVRHYQPSNRNKQIFQILARIGSPDLALAAYSALFWVRNNHDGVYRKLRK